MSLDQHPLWLYASRIYAYPGVEGACLALQDQHGLNVNILLWAAWLGQSGVLLPGTRLAQARAQIGDWDRRIVALRQARRGLREPVENVPEVWRKRVRKLALEAELAAEQVALALLAELASAADRRIEPATREAAIRANLSHCSDGRWWPELDILLAAAQR